jgi:hypothetical protein
LACANDGDRFEVVEFHKARVNRNVSGVMGDDSAGEKSQQLTPLHTSPITHDVPQ